MSYATVKAALQAQILAQLPALNKLNDRGKQVGVMVFEPTSIQTAPMVFFSLDSFERETTGQVTAMRYFIDARLVIKWTDNEGAEAQLEPYVNAIPAAIDADPSLGNVLQLGRAKVERGSFGWLTIGSAQFRVGDFRLNVLEKAAFQSGI